MKLSFIWNISEGFPKPTVNVIDSEQKIPKQSSYKTRALQGLNAPYG